MLCVFSHTQSREQNQTQPWGALAIRPSAAGEHPVGGGWQARLQGPPLPSSPARLWEEPLTTPPEPGAPLPSSRGLASAAKGEMFWFLTAMFTQRAHWVLSPRGRQVHASPRACGCVGDGKQHRLHSHARPRPRTPAGAGALSLAGKADAPWLAQAGGMALLLLLRAPRVLHPRSQTPPHSPGIQG